MGRGAVWRRWDLHVHTPASVIQNYGGEASWDRYLTDLANLPPSMSVLGINDYWFLDGYDRVRTEWLSGRLPNIEQLFPLVEMRTAELAGAGERLRRINVHVIFAEDVSSDLIRDQFLSGIVAEMKLGPEAQGNGVRWSGHATRESVADLGRRIRSSVTPEVAERYPSSDLVVGFDNLVVPWEAIDKRLRLEYFAGSAITAVGKTEWDAMNWAGGSIGLKKDILNRSDISFTAAANADAYKKSRAALTSARVRDRLLDCSDAHHFSDAREKDRIGNCLTWLNCDPTFAGLLHAIEEFDERVYVGDEPARVRAVRSNPSSVVDYVTISPRNKEVADVYFDDVTVELNDGFIAIIGNKGQGKSALVDIIGLLGNSRNEESFSFLSSARFRNPKKNSASTHRARLQWLDGHHVERRLDARTDDEVPESVTYLPQSLIDEICSDEPGVAADRFRVELENVVFSHIASADRLGASSLSELLAQKTRSLEERLRLRRAELGKLNRDVARVRRLATKARVESLREELKQLQDREAQWLAQEPAILPLPEDSDPALVRVQAQLEDAEGERARLSAEIDQARAAEAQLASQHEAARQLETALETLEGQVERFRLEHLATFENIGVAPADVLTFAVNRQPLSQVLARMAEQREGVRSRLNPEVHGSLGHQFADSAATIEALEAALGAPARAHAESVKNHRDWAQVLDSIRGLIEGERGIGQVKRDLEEVGQVGEQLARLVAERTEVTRAIHAVLMDVVAVYQDVYRPAVNFIEGHRVAASAGLEFAADLRVTALRERLWEMVARNVTGEFLGREESDAKVAAWIDETVFSDADSLVAFLNKMDDAMNDGEALGADPDRMIKKGRSVEELYDFLFGLNYLEPYFLLLYRSVPIDELSPGEKGTLLLVFYLLVDRSNRPLLLDQPDENLDNQTVNNVLVPALKEAKTRRQIIVVTHSPNVAVVADADQIIVANRDESQFAYVSGAIEDPVINSHVVNVLEGTWPAFRNRDSKYQKLVAGQAAEG